MAAKKKSPSAPKSPSRKKSARAKAKRLPRPREAVPETVPDCFVVGVGASAGGLDAFRRFLKALPEDTGMAFVLIQHLDPAHESRMAEILGRSSVMPVSEARDGMPLEANHVYINPPNGIVGLCGNALTFEGPMETDRPRMVIDRFFRSLAEARKERAVCIVLSGMGADGSQGLREVKAAGGMAMAQDPRTAEYDAMPRAAIASGYVDFVLPVEEMPARLSAYSRHPFSRSHEALPSLVDREPGQFQTILSLLRAHTDHDFRCYKPGTLNRRIQRRMSLRQVETLGDYVVELRKDPQEVQALFRDLLISVTGFFRERDAWKVLAEEVIAPIIAAKAPGEAVRVWVPGCATGEEAYSVAVVVTEEVEKAGKELEVQIFATDIDEKAVNTARAGLYSRIATAEIEPDRVNRYFTEEGDSVRVSKKVREGTVFALQNLITDPPFSKVDLVTCRNVMIYLSAETQARLLEMFHFGLNDGGYLFLGNSESINRLTELFEPVSKTWRIYRKIGTSRRPSAHFPVPVKEGLPGSLASEKKPRVTPAFAMPDAGARLLLERFAPACVLVTSEYLVRYSHGPMRDYLAVPGGEPTTDLMKMALPGLGPKLRGVLRRALESGHEERAHAPSVVRGRESVSVEIRAEIVPGSKESERLLLVTFRDQESAVDGKASAGAEADEGGLFPDDTAEMIFQMEHELRVTRDDLQGSIEELKASNEEVMSMNEELQSTNEELETSREELQSLNEELTTVNGQLEEKIRELEVAHDDLANLLRSTEIATLFLDRDFRIRQFTEASGNLLRLISADLGRPMSDLAPRMEDPDLFHDAREVLDKLVPVEREVRSEGGEWYMRSIRPYRTSGNRIEGVVLTFVNITKVRSAKESLAARELQHGAVARLGVAALAEGDMTELFDLAACLVAEMLPSELAKVLELKPGGETLLLRSGVGWKEGLVGAATVGAENNSQAGYTLHSSKPVIVEDLATEGRFTGPPLLVEHGVVSGISVIIGDPEHPWGVLGAHTTHRRAFTSDDVNFVQMVANILASALERERSEQQLRENETRLQLLTDTMPALIAFVDQDLCYRFVNRRYEDFFERPREAIIGRPVRALLEEAYPRIEPQMRRALEGERVEYSYRIADRGGDLRELHVTYIPHRDEANRVTGFYSLVMDLTMRVRFEERLRLVMENMSDAFLSIDREGKVSFANDAAATLLCLPNGDLPGRDCADIFAPETAPAECIDRAREENHETRLTDFLAPDGRTYHLRCVPAEGQVSVFFVDTTEEAKARAELLDLNDRLEEHVRERTEELSETARSLREREQELAVLAENVPACFAYVSADLVCRYANRGFQVAFRKNAVKPVGKPLRKIMGAAAYGTILPHAEQALLGNDSRFEGRMLLPDKRQRWINATLVPRWSEENVAEGFFFLGLDITEAKELEGKLVRVVDEEKFRFASELHDGIGSLLSGLSFRVEALTSDAMAGQIPETDEVQVLGRLLNDAIAQTRSLAHGLNPVPAKTDGLGTSLAELTESFHTATGIGFELDCPDMVEVDDPFVANNLYRIAQEATANAVKHSACTRVVIRLRRSSGIVRLTVIDNGRGITAENKPGMGYNTMRYRATAMGGTLETEVVEGGGTRVMCQVPLKSDTQ